MLLSSNAEPSVVFEVKLAKSITDYIGLSILARKYALKIINSININNEYKTV